MSDAAYIIKV